MFHFMVLGGLLFWCVVTDLHERRIPNRLILVGLSAAFASHTLSLLFDSVPTAGQGYFSPLSGAALALVLLLPLYLLRACGAGDVKLLAMVGAFVGPAVAPWVVLWTLVAGGALGLLFMLRKEVARKTLDNLRFLITDWATRFAGGQLRALAPLEQTAARMPYAVAIAAGTAVAVYQQSLQV